MKKKIYKILIWAFFCIVAGTGVCVQSEAVSSVANAEKNVFRLMTMARCGDKEFIIRTGTCFLIGDVSREQDQYILTTNQVLLVSEDVKRTVIQENKLKKDSELQIFYRVIVSDDIALEASIFNQAQSEDYAILQLGSSLADRKGIPLGDMEKVKDDADLIILGYDPAEYRLKTYTSTLDNRNSNTEKLAYTNNSMQVSDLGAPVLDKNGNLLGLHNAMDDNAGYAVAVNKLKQSFQTLNVQFQSADSKYEELMEKILDAKELAKKDDVYSASSLQELNQAIEQAQDVYENAEAVNTEYENQIAALDIAIGDLSEKGAANKIIMIILGVLIVGVGVLVLIVFLRGRKTKGEVHYMDEGPSGESPSAPGDSPGIAAAPIAGSGPGPVTPPVMGSGPGAVTPPGAGGGPGPVKAPSPASGDDPTFAKPSASGGGPVFAPSPLSGGGPGIAPPPVSGGGPGIVTLPSPGAGPNVNVYLVSKMNGEKIGITKSRFVIGSQTGSVDYAITGQSMISRRHAEITMQSGGFYIRDLNSTNHTFVNGNMVAKNTRKRIKNADNIRLANVEYTFVIK